MEMVDSLIIHCSSAIRLTLVKADLIPQLLITLKPQSLSFAEAVDIHTRLLKILHESLWLASPDGLRELVIQECDGQQAVHEIVFQRVLAPLENYIRHLCENRFSIIDGNQSKVFLALLAEILEICAYYQPTMEFVLNLPVILTIPSCLTLFDDDWSLDCFLSSMVVLLREWTVERGVVRQMWKTVLRMLRMEGTEDVIEEKLRNDTSSAYGGWIVIRSIEWNNLHGMN
ncbi:hypothetical protein BLNAU_10085 [Blattamonas nauphoetae]|uniref:Uncharacterized protein n=1 Tax=Blattamonas nauphoetae TaxID=2049346 RepID=A0ABQ9XTZ2_9EUKA|nr:hypothetical protein BLNAU_10085 [Blattamonas nauphoetae]